jgi:glycosyltransferase involved in cell wall biosynthesis
VSVVFLVPALDAERSVGRVVSELLDSWPKERGEATVLVVDDGSSDDTAAVAERAGAVVLRHATNLGKGAALHTGLTEALRRGATLAVSVDADGQHPAEEAVRVALDPAPRAALVLGVRDLEHAGAPRANRVSNAISNFFLSLFAGRNLADTQCGLRRYPLPETLWLGAHAQGYAFEAEVLLRAALSGWAVAQIPIRVLYPRGAERVSHFHPVRDPARIVARVVFTLFVATRS